MQNRTPAPRDQRQPIPVFDPVPRKHDRHDGWTPDRQRAFIEALADTGSVKIACRMVNMAHASVYALRRQPGAEGFRRAWAAALDLGQQLLKDEAFDRALNGQLVPVFTGGKLMGFRRKRNDALLMFCLRHYSQDANGRRVTINYFSSKATAGAANLPLPQSGEGGSRSERGEGTAPALAQAEAGTATIRTVTSGAAQADPLDRLEREDDLAAVLDAFRGVDLDEEAKADILRVLHAAAARHREVAKAGDWNAGPDALAVQAEDPETDFIRVPDGSIEYFGELESGAETEEFVPFVEGERPWETIGEEPPQWFREWEERNAQRGDRKAIARQGKESANAGRPARSAVSDGKETIATDFRRKRAERWRRCDRVSNGPEHSLGKPIPN